PERPVHRHHKQHSDRVVLDFWRRRDIHTPESDAHVHQRRILRHLSWSLEHCRQQHDHHAGIYHSIKCCISAHEFLYLRYPIGKSPADRPVPGYLREFPDELAVVLWRRRPEHRPEPDTYVYGEWHLHGQPDRHKLWRPEHHDHAGIHHRYFTPCDRDSDPCCTNNYPGTGNTDGRANAGARRGGKHFLSGIHRDLPLMDVAPCRYRDPGTGSHCPSSRRTLRWQETIGARGTLRDCCPQVSHGFLKMTEGEKENAGKNLPLLYHFLPADTFEINKAVVGVGF